MEVPSELSLESALDHVGGIEGLGDARPHVEQMRIGVGIGIVVEGLLGDSIDAAQLADRERVDRAERRAGGVLEQREIDQAIEVLTLEVALEACA